MIFLLQWYTINLWTEIVCLDLKSYILDGNWLFCVIFYRGFLKMVFGTLNTVHVLYTSKIWSFHKLNDQFICISLQALRKSFIINTRIGSLNGLHQIQLICCIYLEEVEWLMYVEVVTILNKSAKPLKTTCFFIQTQKQRVFVTRRHANIIIN